ncbi:methyltransferase domain-containing protein [Nodosilinea sp. LEGE 07298]|uniref:methyltransferase domain-containing protein n=1 Tax=Nodosilinea sp. LEGE 07298 TaxID=2777970 RepID=UPI0018807C58|nr:methyltransferase domain-containing protein [Nodosilinea sp. LEGE 07298]MBE9112765.1 methyltransferase domain-containing protein [Nodosilinea sp. LEGE 07298]
MALESIDRHNQEILKNADAWKKKPALRAIYKTFHQNIARHLAPLPQPTVELGSGVADIQRVIPGCIRTDIFPNPWIDQVENAYALSFASGSLSNLVLFDVFHHLRYPGTALKEFERVLAPGGRVIWFEPCVSLLGLLVYGALHPEPLALNQSIQWYAPPAWNPAQIDYYAAQGNASRLFLKPNIQQDLNGFRVVTTQRYAAVSYVASGGYSKPQMYPTAWLPLMTVIDRLCDRLPQIFATRLLVVLEKAT